uniref:Uncharacterized protein n=1 Tax=Ananas comosus var. bracteatus TaxID=296719 RepID=A0A6V7QNB7_ANACO|nr:unnamed protein product [Ananas comosus var. bracteatus]
MANGTRLQQQTTRYNQSFEEALQSARDVNQKLDVLIEALQKEEARRHEIMMQENARRHEQILELIRSRFVHAREKEITVQDPKEEKELIPIPIPIPLEKRVSSLTNSVIDKPAAVKEVEQKHLGILQMEDSNGHDVRLSDSASRPEGLLRLHATQPPPTKPIPNVETRNIEHSSSDRSKLRDNIIPPPIRANNGEEPPLGTHKLQESEEEPNLQWPATSKRTMMQGRCYGYGEEYITGQQCKDSSLHMLPAQKRGEVGAESEAAKEEGCEPQQVEDGNVYEATSIKESDNQTQLILNDDSILHSLVDFGIAKATGVEFTTIAPLIVVADPEHKVLSQSSCPQFARKKPGHKLLADSRKLRLKGSDLVLRVDWMKEYRQVPFDLGPNKVTTHSIEGVRQNYKFWAQLRVPKLEELDQVPGTDWVKIYRQVPFDPGPNQVTLHSIERATHMPIITSKLQMVIKHRGQTIAAQPYMIKSGVTTGEMHHSIQKPHREIEDSLHKKEFITIQWEVSNQFQAKSSPKMKILMLSGNDPRNWISSYVKYFMLHKTSYQQEVEIAAMQGQQEKSEDFEVQRLIRHSRLTGACLVKGFVNEHKELGAIIKMPHPCSRFLAYKQGKLQESNRNLGVTLNINGECKALTMIICKWMQTVQNRSEEDHLLTEFHTFTAWQVDKGIEQLTRWSGIVRDMHQLMEDCEVCLRAKEENRPKHCYKKLKLEEWWSYTRFYISSGRGILQDRGRLETSESEAMRETGGLVYSHGRPNH